MATVDSILAELEPELGQVQQRSETWVCDYCLGPVHPSFHCCYGCGRLEQSGAPASRWPARDRHAGAFEARWFVPGSTPAAGLGGGRADPGEVGGNPHLRTGTGHRLAKGLLRPHARDQRVLLVEDSWVTGATALAAAGALLGFGARSVVIMPLGRVIDVSFWDGSEHPYVARVTGDGMERYDIRRWSR